MVQEWTRQSLDLAAPVPLAAAALALAAALQPGAWEVLTAMSTQQHRQQQLQQQLHHPIQQQQGRVCLLPTVVTLKVMRLCSLQAW
jgi:hypothetical protein